MPTVNEIIQDESVAHAVSLQQYSLGVVRKIIATLNRSDARLMVALAEALDRMPAESFTVERLESLLASVSEVNAAAYAKVAQELQHDIKELAGYELNWQYQLFQTTIPAPVQVHYPIAQVTVEQAYAAAMARPFQGRLLRDWASTIEADRMAKVRNAVRQGYMEGKTVAQIVSEIRGTRANNYADGFLQRPRKDLETVVRTAISHTAATARQEFTSANSDIIKAERWVSTLDTKTSAQCRIRDQLQYTAETHKPIGHRIPWLQGPGKLHFNCRSTSSPVTKSWRELGIPIDEMTPSQRASMDGQVPADQDYNQWLSKQSDARIEQVLGPERFKLYKSGGIKLDDFYSPTGQWYTIDQLKQRDEAAFSRIAA
ncbi:phage minor head protein [Pseudomonas pseudonitroreducens]|uniref:phage minor head protein n=1 Tax=Pseudomonas pseudonitroreducens TaxID=2892326 RepID=UPI001F383A14|nr:phage minor head protein [Pseudomonas pseudonitroreducens]